MEEEKQKLQEKLKQQKQKAVNQQYALKAKHKSNK
jgi:hypothetical protein